MPRRKSVANLLSNGRTNGRLTSVGGWAERAKANTSYHADSSSGGSFVSLGPV
jgi:hypothetical protein